MSFVMDKLRILCQNLKEQCTVQLQQVGGIEYVPCGYKENNDSPKDGWQPFNPGMRIGGVDKHAWFRFDVDTPTVPAYARVFLRALTGLEGQWDARNPQGLVYINGRMTQGLDTNHTQVLLEPGSHLHIEIYYYTGMEDGDIEYSLQLVQTDTRIQDAYYDFSVPYCALKDLNEYSTDYTELLRVLELAANLIDMRVPKSEAYFATLADARAFLKKELYEGLCGRSREVVDLIGHTHIDVAWLWTYAQTREKAQRSFATVLQLMREYPEYKFMSSQPQLYSYVKQAAPELYEEIRRRVKEGRWEVEGAMWLEADCNLISGESMVRQILHGKKFMKDEFGVDSRTLWLPDVFGYSAALPQILKKCGVDHFVTSKISWSESNRLPYDTFVWEGIDGSEVFADFLTAQDVSPDGKPTTGTTYVGNTEPGMVLGTWVRYQQKEYNNETIITFGYGDGGGGPTRHMLETQRRTAPGLPGHPKTQMSFAGDWIAHSKKNFEENTKKLHHTPRWVGELYLEYHRGTYTSIAKNKRNNRKSEFLLQRTELISTTNRLLCGVAYPAEKLYHSWETVLRNQFHDVIPGSSIFEVYQDSDAQYAEVEQCAGELEAAALENIASNVDCSDGILVYNPLGFARSDVVVVDGKSYETPEIPAFGWKVIRPDGLAGKVSVKGRSIENVYYRLTLDKAGRIEQLYDKRAARQVLKTGEYGNELQIFEDFPRDYDAWEISNYYKQKMWVMEDEAELTTVQDGNRAGIRIRRRYLDSVIEQTVYLYDSLERIDFVTELDWHNEHQLLKAAFPLDVHASRATYEIQFGNLERPTHENTSWDAAKFEVCAHKWADISEDGYGVSLMNDCKYGYSTEGSTLKLTLLKCATFPNPHADKGRHSFTYSLLPHSGGYREGGTVKKAYALNVPLLALPVKAHAGRLAPEWSLLHCDADNIVVDTVKQAEDGKGMIVRLYDSFDRRSTAVLTLGFEADSVQLCDMLENPLQTLETDGHTISLPVGNFEVVTLRVCPK